MARAFVLVLIFGCTCPGLTPLLGTFDSSYIKQLLAHQLLVLHFEDVRLDGQHSMSTCRAGQVQLM